MVPCAHAEESGDSAGCFDMVDVWAVDSDESDEVCWKVSNPTLVANLVAYPNTNNAGLEGLFGVSDPVRVLSRRGRGSCRRGPGDGAAPADGLL